MAAIARQHSALSSQSSSEYRTGVRAGKSDSNDYETGLPAVFDGAEEDTGMREHPSIWTKRNSIRTSKARTSEIGDSVGMQPSDYEVTGPARDDADPAIVLKAFRLVGSVDGVHLTGLQAGIRTLKDQPLKKKVKRILPGAFAEYDRDCDGFLDINEFEDMINSSLWLKSAVYHFTRTADEEDQNETGIGVSPDVFRSHDLFEVMSLVVVALSGVLAAVRADNMPHWPGWDYFELAFACFFTFDMCIHWALAPSTSSWDRVMASQDKGRKSVSLSPWEWRNGSVSTDNISMSMSSVRSVCKWCWKSTAFKKTRNYLSVRSNILDTAATLIGWLDVGVIFLLRQEEGAQELSWIGWVRWLRLLRLVRLLARLGRVVSHLTDLAVVLQGVVEGFRLAVWGLLAVALITSMWSIFLRNSVEYETEHEHYAVLQEVFPNIPQTMNFIFRCMVVKTDGSCTTAHGPIMNLVSGGFLLEFLWLLTELFIMFVILNVVSAIYVLQATENAKKVQDSVHQNHWREDEDKLERLDKLVRTLTYPCRGNDCHPKERYAQQEAVKLQAEYPDVADKIPNLEKELLEVATDVQKSRALLMTAVYEYKAKESNQFRKLESTPSAMLYTVDGEEQFFTSRKHVSTANHLGIKHPPSQAKESPLLQDETNLQKLLEQAAEVQSYVKSLVLPRSPWAMRPKAGSSGKDQWRKSSSLCDEALDPGPKDPERIRDKVRRYQGRFERNRDYARLGLIYDTVEHLVVALRRFVDGIGEGISLATIENRFVEPHPLGWRDINLLLKVRLRGNEKAHIMEVQMMLRELKDLRPINHKIYEHVRTIPDEVLTRIMDRLVTDTTLDLNLTKSEWNQCLHNQEVTVLLDHFGIPISLRKRLFELIDTDDSGNVSSAELQELLRLNRVPAQTLELISCHLRLREMQRYSRFKLKDDIAKPIIKEVKQLLRQGESSISTGIQAQALSGELLRRENDNLANVNLTRDTEPVNAVQPPDNMEAVTPCLIDYTKANTVDL